MIAILLGASRLHNGSCYWESIQLSNFLYLGIFFGELANLGFLALFLCSSETSLMHYRNSDVVWNYRNVSLVFPCYLALALTVLFTAVANGLESSLLLAASFLKSFQSAVIKDFFGRLSADQFKFSLPLQDLLSGEGHYSD